MGLKALIVIGILVFIPSIYMLIKGYKGGKYIKKYGFIAYFGACLVYSGVLLSMESVFMRLPGKAPGLLPVFITFCVCLILSKLLLKPTFIKKK